MAPNDLTITWLGDPVRLTITGEVDVSTREQFKAALAETFGDQGDVRLDLEGVPFMDTHAVTVVMHTAQRLQEEGGRLVVHHPPESLARIFQMMWADRDGRWLYISGERGEP